MPSARATTPSSPWQRLVAWFAAFGESLRSLVERQPPSKAKGVADQSVPLLAADPEIWERPTQPLRRATAPVTPPKLHQGESGQQYLIASHQATGGFGKFRYTVDMGGQTWGAREVSSPAVEAEINILRQLAGPLAVHDEIKREAKRWAILTLFGGELVDAFARIREDSTRKALARHAVSQLATDLVRVHKHGYVHRDVTIGGALWRDDGTIVCNDFGRTLVQDAKGNVNGPPNTMGYTAPELLFGGIHDAKVDVWSLAMAYTAMHDNRLQRLFALAPRNKDLIITYVKWRAMILAAKGPIEERLSRHHDRWDEYFLALAKADPEMCLFVLQRMLDPKAVSRATMEEVQTAMRRIQPPGCAAEREVVRALQNLADGDKKREAAILALRSQLKTATA